MKILLDLDLPAPLHAELEAAAKESRISTAIFAAECVESILASRILPRVRAGALGPRINTEETL